MTDTIKLDESDLPGRKGVLIYGFDYPERPLIWMIEAFEAMSHQRGAILGERESAWLHALVHPVHCCGAVFAWEVLGLEHGENAPFGEPQLSAHYDTSGLLVGGPVARRSRRTRYPWSEAVELAAQLG